MMAILNTFVFKITPPNDSWGVDFNALSIDETYHFNEHKKIDGYSSFQDVSQHSQKFAVSGELVLKNVYVLKELSLWARLKKPVVFALGTGEVTLVIIKNIKKSRKLFNPDGSFFNQTFSLELEEVVYDLFSKIRG